MKGRLIAFVIGSLLFESSIARAQINNDLRTAAAYRAEKLVAQDAELKASFRAAQQNTVATVREKLQVEQTQWLLLRKEQCGLTEREASAKDWPKSLGPSKADCVTDATQSRIAELRKHRPLTSVEGFSDSSRLSPIQEFTFPIGHSSGKWYLEIEIQRELLSRTGENQIQVGIDNVDEYRMFNGLSKTAFQGTHEIIRVLVDLDLDKFTWHGSTNATTPDWQRLTRGTKPFTLKLKGGDDLQFILARGQVRVNHGQRPFRYPVPTDFAGWHVPEHLDEPYKWLLPPYERVGTLDRFKLASNYWTWLLDREPSQNPVQDHTGASCTLKQSEGVWYLAGAAEVDRIERQCIVPAGAMLVIPVMAVMLSFEDMADCQKNKELASLAPYTLQNTWMEIDGKRFDRLQDYSASVSTCPALEIAGKLRSRQANWLGLWVPLRPLPRGEHTVNFGGRFNALNLDRKVTYKITVQ